MNELKDEIYFSKISTHIITNNIDPKYIQLTTLVSWAKKELGLRLELKKKVQILKQIITRLKNNTVWYNINI